MIVPGDSLYPPKEQAMGNLDIIKSACEEFAIEDTMTPEDFAAKIATFAKNSDDDEKLAFAQIVRAGSAVKVEHLSNEVQR